MVNKCAIIVQCRYDSNRLPGKILLKLANGITALENIIRRNCHIGLPMIIATTDREIDNSIADFFNAKIKNNYDNVTLYRGDCDNLINRLYQASKKYKYIARITGDDIFTASEYILDALDWSEQNNKDYTYLKNIIPGCDFEVMKIATLKGLSEKYSDSKIEAVEHYFQNNHYRVGEYNYDQKYNNDYHNIRLTLDNSDDLIVINTLLQDVQNVNLETIVKYFDKHACLKQINKIPKISIYCVNKNYEKWLDRCLVGIESQTFRDTELIFVDYGSKNIDQIQIYKKLKTKKIFFIWQNTELSFLDAIRFALEKCEGKYVLRADIDDIMRANALGKMYELAEKTSAAIVIPDYVSSMSDKKPVPGNLNNLTCHALIEKKKLEYIKYIDGQKFRDGTSLIAAFKKYNFRIQYLQEALFLHTEHARSLTKRNAKLIQKTDEEIINAINI